MKHTNTLRTLLCLVLVMLLAAAVFTGCNNTTNNAASGADVEPEEELTSSADDLAPAESDEQISVGTGEKTFYFVVTDKEGQTSSYTIHTDAETVGEALLENRLIDGEDSEYGLYVTTVNGETLDWDADGMYWAFYEDGEYAASGVDTTVITEGATYAMTATAG